MHSQSTSPVAAHVFASWFASMQVKLFFNSLPQKKWLFTNANEKSALHCLKLLDLEVTDHSMS